MPVLLVRFQLSEEATETFHRSRCHVQSAIFLLPVACGTFFNVLRYEVIKCSAVLFFFGLGFFLLALLFCSYLFSIDSIESTGDAYVITYRAATDAQNYTGYYDMQLTVKIPEGLMEL